MTIRTVLIVLVLSMIFNSISVYFNYKTVQIMEKLPVISPISNDTRAELERMMSE